MVRNSSPKVLLLSLPWAPVTEPSLGLSVLKSELLKHGISCKVCQLNMLLLKYLKASTYWSIYNMFGVNDFLFTRPFEHNVSQKQLHQLSLKIDEALRHNYFADDENYQTR